MVIISSYSRVTLGDDFDNICDSCINFTFTIAVFIKGYNYQVVVSKCVIKKFLCETSQMTQLHSGATT